MDLKHMFGRNKQSSMKGNKSRKGKTSTTGAHKLSLEYEGFLSPSNSRPAKPSTPAARLGQPQVSTLYSAIDNHLFTKPFADFKTCSDKSATVFPDHHEVTDENHSNPIRNASQWKRGFFSLNCSSRSGRRNCPDKSTNSSPTYWPVPPTIDGAPHSGWLRRRISTTSKGQQPSPAPSFTTIPPYYEPLIFDDDSLTALPSLPGYENELSRAPEKLSSGAAARAAAAAQNGVLDTLRSLRLAEPRLTRDSESGVGIEVRDRGEVIAGLDVPVIRKDPLSVLPEELVGQILSYLDADSLINAELVSLDWHQSASSHHVWRDVFRAEFQNVCQTLTIPSASRRIWSKALNRQDWKDMWRARKALDQRWKDGHAAAIYLEGHKDSVYCVQFDDDKILTGSRDRTVRIWDAKTYECIKVLGLPSRGAGSAVQPLPPDMASRGHRPFARIFSPPSTVAPDVVSDNLYHYGSILCLQYDDDIMITGSSDCTLILWDVKADYRPIKRLRRHAAGVLDVCFDDRHILSCSKDATICLWDRNSGNFLRKMTGHRGPVNAVQLRGDLVVSASGDGIAKLWNIRSGLCIKEFPSRDRGLACVEFSPDSRTILAGGNDQVVYQFDTSTGELVRQMKGHEGLVRSLHLNSATGRVVSGSYDTSVKAFDLRSGETIVDFSRWTSSWILSAKSDYRRIVATSQDSRAVIMDFGYRLPGIDSLKT